MKSTIGTKKSLQRWETCLIFTITSYLQPALVFMYNKRHKDQTIKIEAEKFIKQAVIEARRKFAMSNKLPLDVAVDVLKNLRKLKILISLDDDEFSDQNLSEFYANLKLNGSENFLESFHAIKGFNVKIRNDLKGSSKRKIEELVEMEKINYSIRDGNLLCE